MDTRTDTHEARQHDVQDAPDEAVFTVLTKRTVIDVVAVDTWIDTLRKRLPHVTVPQGGEEPD